VKEINRINEKEIELGTTGASWHDEFKDSAYVFIGGLHFDLTEGDVITIFSQYGEVMDVNMPRDKETGKPRGFAFLMYEDQRSTVLAVDNLNGAKVLERTLRVDHVKNYKQPKSKNDDGEWVDAEDQSLNAKPEMLMGTKFIFARVSCSLKRKPYTTIDDGNASDSSDSSAPSIDPEDPMRDYLLAKRKEEKALKKAKKAKSKSKRKDETPEERRARKERKREKKSKKVKSAAKGVEDLLNSLNRRDEREPGRGRGHDSDRSRSPMNREKRRRSYSRSPSRTPPRERRRASREHSVDRPADRSEPRSRRAQGSRHDYGSGSGGPYGHDAGSRRSRDYD
ncbi:hypothetical protein BDN72DRAFT_763991, partial [Pluteus cervinus]